MKKAKWIELARGWTPVQIWLCLFLPVYLLAVGEGGLTAVSSFKTELLYWSVRALALCAAGEIALELRRRRLAGERLLRLSRPRPASIAALVFLAVTLLSAACSPYGERVWQDEQIHEGAVTISCYVFLFLTLSRWARPDRAAFYSLAAGLTAFLVICAFQLGGENPFLLYPEGHFYADRYVNRMFLGTVGNVDLVSVLLCCAAALLTVAAAKAKGRRRIVPAVLALGAAAVLVLIRVLCGLVGLAAGAWLCLLVLLPVKKKTRLLLVLASALLALAACFALWRWDWKITFFHELHEILNGRVSNSFGTGRIFIWRQMLRRVPGQLALGVGPDATRLTDLERFQRFDAQGRLVAVAVITDAHCLPLQILYCLGLPGLVSWLAVIGLSLRSFFRTGRTPAAAALGAGVVCFFAAMLFCFSSVIIIPFFWIALGLLAGERIN